MHWQYLKYVLKHKWYVLQECFKFGLYWQGLIHDWQKFTPTEWFPYVDYFWRYPDKSKPVEVKLAFDKAWHHHQAYGPHHWQYWLLVYDDSDDVLAIEMPEKFAKEMVADWRGASRAILGHDNTVTWYLGRQERMKKVLHPNTRAFVEELLGVQ